MRAVVLRRGRLDVREIADPVPGRGHLLLRTIATAICASDGAHVVVDPATRSAHDVWREFAKPGGRCVIFECVGAPGFIEKLIDECAHGSLIVCAGGWYTGDSVSVTPATGWPIHCTAEASLGMEPPSHP